MIRLRWNFLEQLMRIDNATIEKIKLQADILDVIGEFVRLRKMGGRFVGLCPFHEDKKSPSFSVSPDKGVYHCFGCKKSGNMFTFLKDYLGLNFNESVEYLAKKYNINLTYSSENIEKSNKTDLAFKALSLASSYYANYLTQKNGKKILNYFLSRDFSSETIKKFALGASPDSFDETTKFLLKNGLTSESLEDAGLIIVKEDGKKYDRFRNRAMFPIKDFIGRVIGFGARQIDNSETSAKYINSPQSLVYDKSSVLFGLFEAKNSIRNEGASIIVEGYADLLTLHQAGIQNVVASSGTAFTSKQLELLKRYTSTIYLVFDADQAGFKATERAIVLGLEAGFDINIVSLPAGEDPDSIVRNNGRKLFDTRLSEAENFLDYLTKKAMSEENPSPQAKANITRAMLDLVLKVEDRLQHDFYLSNLAKNLRLSENQIRLLYNEKINLEKKKQNDEINYHYPQKDFSELVHNSMNNQKSVESSNESVTKNEQNLLIDDFVVNFNEIYPEERMLLKICLELPKYFKMVLDANIGEENLISEAGKTLFSIILDYSEEINIIQALLQAEDIDSRITQALMEILVDDEKASENWKLKDKTMREVNYHEAIKDISKRLEIRSLDMQINEIKQKMRNASDEHIDVLLAAQFELSTKKDKLYSSMISG